MHSKRNATLIAAALTSSVFAGAPAGAQVGPQEYAAKFVCGSSPRPTIVVPGAYLTEINVHNPREASDEFRWKVALAGRGTAGRISNFDNFALRNDEALEIDCGLISRRLTASGIPVPTLPFTGFVVIQSRTPLDVVAVYTAAALTSTGTVGQVASFHTERVPPRPMRD
jgi:hypothetical protein